MSPPPRIRLLTCCIAVASSILVPAKTEAQFIQPVGPDTLHLSPQQQEWISQMKTTAGVVAMSFASIDVDQVSEGGELELHLMPGFPVTLANELFEETPFGGFNWSGSDASTGSAAVLTIEGELVVGTIRIGGRLFEIQPLSGTVHAVTEWDEILLPPEALSEAQSETVYQDPHFLYFDSGMTEQADDCSTITLLVAYTSAAAASTSTSGGIDQLITNAVFAANVALVNSQITTYIEVVHRYQTPTEESLLTGCGRIAHDVYRLQTDGDLWFDEAHYYRDLHAADVVSLIGFYPGCAGMAGAVFAHEATAVFVASTNAITLYNTFAHELAHIFGAGHNREAGGAYSPFPDGFAFCSSEASPVHPSGVRTIVSYFNNCQDRVLFFSNPSVTYDGSPVGITDSQDNARVMNSTACTVAAFRQEATVAVTVSSTDVVQGEIATIEVTVTRNSRGVPFAEVELSYRPAFGIQIQKRVVTDDAGKVTVPFLATMIGPGSIQVRSEGARAYQALWTTPG